MPRKPPLPLADAVTLVNDMIEVLGEPDSPGFSKTALSRTCFLHRAERLNKLGGAASPHEVEAGQFNGRVVFRMKAEEKLMNSLGNMHGGCVATIVDNLSSMAVYLHLPDLQPTTPWSFLGVTQSLSVVYLSAAPLDEWIEVDCCVKSIGARVVVLEADMWLLQDEDGSGKGTRVRRTATGTHTKMDNSLASKM